ncbi:hypothetical protein SUNI508_00007 [Seiridium unicorne]|uniref:Uncharacterized protein n=1 Tax=Seiridium unicorne TaxID=138068 RepID=A0ABR2VJ73_9PEZI
MDDITTGLMNKCHVRKRTAYPPQKAQSEDNHHGVDKSLDASTPRGTAFQFSNTEIDLAAMNGRTGIKGRFAAALQRSRKRSMPFDDDEYQVRDGVLSDGNNIEIVFGPNQKVLMHGGQDHVLVQHGSEALDFWICGYRKAGPLTTRAAAYPSVPEMVLQQESVEDSMARHARKDIISKQDEFEEMVSLRSAPLKEAPASQRSNLDNARPTIKIRFSGQEAFHLVAKRRNSIVEIARFSWEVCDELLKQAHGTFGESNEHSLVASLSRI